MTGPKHSTSVPSSVGLAVPLSVDEKEVAPVPNPVSGLAVKSLLGPQVVVEVDICDSVHKLLLLLTLQCVTPFITLHLKVKVSPGQVGGGAVNCPATSPGEYLMHTYTLHGICDPVILI